MRATVMYAAGDVRVEDVPDAAIVEPTDAVVRVTRACNCGSDLWPYASMERSETGQSTGHEAIGVVEDVGSRTASALPATRACRPRACTSASSATTVGEDDARMPSLHTLSDVMGTGHHAAVVAKVGPGKRAAVVGDGAVGLRAVIAAKRMADRETIKVMVTP